MSMLLLLLALKTPVSMTVPSTVTTGAAVSVRNMSSLEVGVHGTFVQTMQIQGSLNCSDYVTIGSDVTAPSLTAVTPNLNCMRIKTTAHTSGSATSAVAGVLQPEKNITKGLETKASVANGAAISVLGLRNMSYQVSGTFVATLQLQGSTDGTNWVAIGSTDTGAGLTAISAKFGLVRMATTAYTSGTPVTTLVGAKVSSFDVLSPSYPNTVRTFTVHQLVATPGAPTVTNVPPVTDAGVAPDAGASGTYTYKLVGLDAYGAHSAAGSAGTTTSGPVVLSGGDYNHLAWTAVPTAAGGYDVYRTAGGATQGYIAHVAFGTNVLDDTGLAGDSATAPTTNTTGYSAGAICSDLTGMAMIMSGTFVASLDIEGSVDGSNYVKIGSSVTTKSSNSVTDTLMKIRVRMSAYTSGTPVVALLGSKP